MNRTKCENYYSNCVCLTSFSVWLLLLRNFKRSLDLQPFNVNNMEIGISSIRTKAPAQRCTLSSTESVHRCSSSSSSRETERRRKRRDKQRWHEDMLVSIYAMKRFIKWKLSLKSKPQFFDSMPFGRICRKWNAHGTINLSLFAS